LNTIETGENSMNHKPHTTSISGGIFLIGLGILIYTGGWWPGIMFVIGLASGAELVFRGRLIPGLLSFLAFSAVPILLAADIPWRIFGPFILISLGAVGLVKAFTRPTADKL
jgi:hypothetical protein